MLFALDIRRNLVYVLVLIKLDFELCFHGQGVDLFLGQQYYDYGCIVLNVEHGESNDSFFLYSINC